MNSFQQISFASEAGQVQVFDHFETDGPMWTGTGKRWERADVRFAAPFRAPPTVQVALAMIDADSGPNLRLELLSEDVRPDGFTAVVHTWSDTRIGRLRLSWLALGPRNDGDAPLWNV